MATFKKTVRVGQFAKKNEDYRDGNILTVLDAGVTTVGTYGEQVIFKCRMPNGDERAMTFNKTSINNMIDAFGEESNNWIGKEVKVWLILQNVQGKMTRVAYLSHPDATIDDEGTFVLGAPSTSTRLAAASAVVDDEDGIDETGIHF